MVGEGFYQTTAVKGPTECLENLDAKTFKSASLPPRQN